MKTDDQGHYIAGALFTGIGISCLIFGIGALFFPDIAYVAWILAIPAFFFGRIGISQLDVAQHIARESELEKEKLKKQTEDAQPFISFLKAGEQVKIVIRVDLTTLGPRTRDFNLQVQRVLNEYFREMDTLPPNPYQALDKLLMTELSPRAAEFGIPNFEAQTIDIRMVIPEKQKKQEPQGVWFNNHV